MANCAAVVFILFVFVSSHVTQADDEGSHFKLSAQVVLQPPATNLSLTSVADALNSLIISDPKQASNSGNTIDSVLRPINTFILGSQSEEQQTLPPSPGFSVEDPQDPNLTSFNPPGSPFIIAVPVASSVSSEETTEPPLPIAPVAPKQPTILKPRNPTKILPGSNIIIAAPPTFTVDNNSKPVGQVPGTNIIVAGSDSNEDTTVKPTTPPTPPKPTTPAKPITPPHECNHCIYFNGVGFVPDASDCTKFYRCVLLPSGDFKAHEFRCPLMLYWNHKILACDFPSNTDCKPATPTNPSTPTGEPGQVVPHECDKRPVPGNSRVFEQKVSNNRWVKMPCAPATAFEAENCGCTKRVPYVPVKPKPSSNEVSKCHPKLHLSFSHGVRDHSKNRFYIENKGVWTKDGDGIFDGKSKLLVNRFANSPLGNDLEIKIVYTPSNRDEKQVLLSNGDCGVKPTLSITTGKDVVTFKLTTIRPSRTRELQVPIASRGHPITVTLILKDGVFTGKVDGISKSKDGFGHIKVTKSSLIIGSGTDLNKFSGSIDDFKMYFCHNDGR